MPGLREKENKRIKMLLIVTVILLLGKLTADSVSAKYDRVLQMKEESLGKVVNEIEMRLNGFLLVIQVVAAGIEADRLTPEAAKPELNQLVSALGLRNAAFFDLDGRLIADATGASPPLAMADDGFRRASRGDVAISGRMVAGSQAQEAYVRLQAPVYNNRQQVSGVITGDLALNDIAKLADAEFLPEGQYFFILDEAGRLLYHPRIAENNPELAAFVQELPRTEGKRTVTLTRKSALNHTREFYLIQTAARLPWSVVVALPLSSLYAEVWFLAAPNLLLMLLGGGVILFLCWQRQRVKQSQDLMENLRLERLHAATQMAAGIAHEVRNPLTSITGFIQLMMQKEDRPKFKNYFEIIMGEIERIDALVSEFQMLARPLRPPHLERTDLAKITGDVVMLMEGQASSRGVEMDFTAPGNSAERAGEWVMADKSQLKQVVINLLRNAIDAVNSGGKVQAVLGRRQEMATLAISDNGPGIPDEIADKIGTPFFTTKEGGSGLGLSVCYAIVHNHGGQIEHESVEGQGTTFTVLLPLAGEQE